MASGSSRCHVFRARSSYQGWSMIVIMGGEFLASLLHPQCNCIPTVVANAKSLAIKVTQKSCVFDGFYPRDAMLARVLAMALCLSVSVCHKSVFCWSGWTDRADFKEIQGKGTFLWNFFSKLRTWKILPRHIDRTCCQLSSRNVTTLTAW